MFYHNPNQLGNIFQDFRQIFTAKEMANTPKWYQAMTKGVTTASELMQKAPKTQEIIEKGQQAVATQVSLETWIKNPMTIAAAALILILLLKKR